MYLILFLDIYFNPNISLEIKPYLYNFIEICKTENCNKIDKKFSKMTSVRTPDHFEDPVFMQCNYKTLQLEYKPKEFFSNEFNQQSLIDHELGHCLSKLAHISAYSNQALGIMEIRPPSKYTESEIAFWTPIWRKNILEANGLIFNY